MARALLGATSMKPLPAHDLARAAGGGSGRPTFQRTPSWGPFGKSPYESLYGTWKTVDGGVRVWEPKIPFVWGK